MIRKRLKAGFTLVELMIVVAIIGVLAVLAIYGVRKYIANSKTAEARQALGRIGKDAAGHFEQESSGSAVLGEGTPAAITRQLCVAATNAVPATFGNVQGKKYQSTAAEWRVGDSATGWNCLKFELNAPQYYQYAYAAPAVSGATANFNATATGDLDGNGISAIFQLNGAAESGRMKLAPQIAETNPDE